MADVAPPPRPRWDHAPLEESLHDARALTVSVVDRITRGGWERLARHAGIPRRRWRRHHPLGNARLIELVDGQPAFDTAAWERFVSLVPGAVALPSRTAASFNVAVGALRPPDRRVRLFDLLGARRRRRRLRRTERALAVDVGIAGRRLVEQLDTTVGTSSDLAAMPTYALASRIEAVLDIAAGWTVQPLVNLISVDAITALVEMLVARDRAPGEALLELAQLQAGAGLEAPDYFNELLGIRMSSGEQRTRLLAEWREGPGGWHAMRELLLEATPLRALGDAPLELVAPSTRAHFEALALPEDDDDLRIAIERVRALVVLREVAAQNRARLHAALRALAWTLALSLESSGALPNADAAFDLEIDDLVRLARGVDVDLPKPRAAVVALDEPTADIVAFGTETLRGIPASAGLASGRVLVVSDPAPDIDVDGAVLVCRTTDPAWMPLLMRCSGLVTERGGPLSHAAIVARELQLPTVVGVRGVVAAASRSSQATVDGSDGVVTLDPDR